ncbi:hypothetical protein BD309DRAFT_973020 [Dichomitus squalens]|nr:hypothetical protein BD309DRAFT_973020 [Dichomitus squalens]
MEERVSISTVPFELLLSIFSSLEDDKQALASCTLVSKAWRDLALPLLYATMKFESARPDTSFLEFAEQHQDLTGYIKHLTLSGQGLRWGITTTPVLVLDALVSILSKLPALLRLSLSSFRFLSRTDSQIEGPRSTPFALRRLDVLDFCQATSLRSAVADLAGLLSAFTVRTLEFGRVHHYRVDNTAYGTACTHRFDVPNLVVWGSVAAK